MLWRIWSIVFDCDSTLVSIEGIDALAGERIEEIRRMTDMAMDGAMALEEVYGERLALIGARCALRQRACTELGVAPGSIFVAHLGLMSA